MYPLETGNYVLIVVGILLVLSGPYIIYRTVSGWVKRRKAEPKAELHLMSDGLNFVIAILFFFAGILFVLNNLRGNPFA